MVSEILNSEFSRIICSALEYVQRLRKEGSSEAEVAARLKEDEVKMLGVGVAKRLEKARNLKTEICLIFR